MDKLIELPFETVSGIDHSVQSEQNSIRWDIHTGASWQMQLNDCMPWLWMDLHQGWQRVLFPSYFG